MGPHGTSQKAGVHWGQDSKQLLQAAELAHQNRLSEVFGAIGSLILPVCIWGKVRGRGGRKEGKVPVVITVQDR